MVLGLFFDMYRLWRGWMRPERLLTDVGDAVYWLVAAVVGAAMLLAANGGEIRLYVAIGAFTGAVFYFAALSHAVVRALILIGSGLARCKDAVFMGTDLIARSIVSDTKRRLRPVSVRAANAGRRAAHWGRGRLAPRLAAKLSVKMPAKTALELAARIRSRLPLPTMPMLPWRKKQEL